MPEQVQSVATDVQNAMAQAAGLPVELWVLVWSGVLLFLLIMVAATGAIMSKGMDWGASNRDEAPATTGVAGRARRAYMNLLENLVLYGAVAIPAHLAGVHTELTVLGAQIFLVARVLHAIIYTAGITVASLRTLAWFAGVVGTALIFYALVTA